MSAKSPRLTKRAQELLELAQEAAAMRGRELIDVEDLLFGIASHDQGAAGQIVRAIGLDEGEMVRALVELTNADYDMSMFALPPIMQLTLRQTGDVVSANASAQELLDQYGEELLDGIRRSLGKILEVDLGERAFVIRSRRLPDLMAAVSIHETTLTRKLARKARELLTVWTFDARAPLTSLRGWAELLPTVADLGDEGTMHLRKIVESADYIVDVTELSLIHSWIFEALESGLPQEPCDLRTVVRETYISTENPNIQVAYDLPDGDCRIRGTKSLISQMVQNVAFLSKERSSENQVVTFRLSRDPAGVWLRVQDQGPTLPKYEQEPMHIGVSHKFKRAYWLQKAVADIIELHGGRLEARNLPEGGAEFAVLFPSAIVISAGDDASYNPTHS